MSIKGSIDELAGLGGKPAFTRTLHVGRPNLGDRDALFRRIAGILDRNWLTNDGPMVNALEDRIAGFLGVKHCIATCNGTTALEIACRALDLRGEVILPAFTFVATAHALEWQGITPVFCDIDAATHCIDPAAVERHISPRTSGIIGVHVWGRPCDTGTLALIAERNKLKLIFDAAHAFGVSRGGRAVGTFGNCEVFSFHATKVFNTFEGGAVTTNDDLLADRLRRMRNFGFAGMDHVVELGINGKMAEINAAMGLTSLESLDAFVEANRANYQVYSESLSTIPGVQIRTYNDDELRNYHYVVTEIGPEFGLDRDQLVDLLHAENVLVRRYFWPGCHRMEPYRTRDPAAGRLLPNTESLCERVLLFPTGQAPAPEDIHGIVSLMKFIHENSLEIATRTRST